MKNKIITLAKEFYNSNRNKGEFGSIATEVEMTSLKSSLEGIIPEWFIELISSIPILGAVIGVPFNSEEYPPEALNWIEFGTVEEIIEESTQMMPGSLLLEKGYFFIARDLSAGEGIYISKESGDDPIVLQFEHGIGESLVEILNEAKVVICNNFSDFFTKSKMEEEE